RNRRNLGRRRCLVRAAAAQEKVGRRGPPEIVKRFWKEVQVAPQDGGWAVQLDGRPVRTPARAALVVPNEALSYAIAEEWRTVEGDVDPRSMPLTGHANAAIDRVAPERQAVALGLARYAETDLACSPSEWPPE